jgi:hypothetical protein
MKAKALDDLISKLELAQQITVVFNKPLWYNNDGHREIILKASKPREKPEEFAVAQTGFVKINEVSGTYMGDRPGLIKVLPSFFVRADSYFVIYAQQIKKIDST